MKNPSRAETELSPELESASFAPFEAERGSGFPVADGAESPFSEAEETELVAELLEVRAPRQFDQFLGRLIQRATRAAGGGGASRLGRVLGGILKGVARTALPASGVAVGGFAPLSSQAQAPGGTVEGAPFDSEMGELDPVDREFEAARRFVRFAGSAAGRAARMHPKVPPRQAVRHAVVAAARRHVPRLLRRRKRWRGPRPAVYAPAVYTIEGQPSLTCSESSTQQCSCGRLIRHGRNVLVVNVYPAGSPVGSACSSVPESLVPGDRHARHRSDAE